ncbi:MAG: glycosyltransferase family 2 protein [bacterium]
MPRTKSLYHCMTNSSSLSVVIVSYNTRDFLRRCLAALRQRAGEGPLDIVVVDNASTDGSVPMLQSEFPEVRLLALPENLGFAQANNRAMQELNCAEVLFLNPDTIITEGAIAKLRRSLSAHPKAAVVGAQLISHSGHSLPSSFAFPSLWREFWNFLPELKGLFRIRALASAFSKIFPQLWRGSYRTDSQARQVDSVAGACMLVRTDAFRKVGGFCGEFFLYHEEMEFCYRLRRSGWEVWLESQARVVHYESQSSGMRHFRLPPMPVLGYRLTGMDYFWSVHRSGLPYALWRFMGQVLLGLRAALCTVSGLVAKGEKRKRLFAGAKEIRKVIGQMKERR